MESFDSIGADFSVKLSSTLLDNFCSSRTPRTLPLHDPDPSALQPPCLGRNLLPPHRPQSRPDKRTSLP